MKLLGYKFNGNRVKRLGRKYEKGARRLGHKTDQFVNNVGRKANHTIDKIDRGISKGDVILRKADHTLDRALSTGVGSVPVLGEHLNLAKTLVHSGRQVSREAKKHTDVARQHANELEKFNSRKALERALHDDAFI